MAHEPGRENCPWAPDTVAVAASARLRVRAFGPAPLRSALSRAIHIPRGIDVTAAGRLLVRSLCMLFDHYLPHQNLQRFSRVI